MSTNDDANIGHASGSHGGFGKEEDPAEKSGSLSSLSIDDIMWRVRIEVARRSNGQVNGVTAPAVPVEIRSFNVSMPRWKPAVPRLIVKDKYELSELLAFSDADFIDAAYRAVLRRAPDEIGFNHYLRVLRGGANSKLLILRDFLATPEGQASGVSIGGMALPILLEKWRRKKLIGPVVGWVHGLLRLGTIADRQLNLAASQAWEVQELGRLVNEVSEHLMQRIVALKVEFAGRVSAAEFEKLKNEHAATKLHVGWLETEMEQQFANRPDGSAIAVLKESGASITSQLSNLEAEVRTRFQEYKEHVNRLKGGLESTEGSIKHLLTRDEQAVGTLRALDPFYAAFEDRFRGDRSLIRSRMEPYLALMREAGAGTREAPILDIGCGRGEWLELIRDNGLVGRGVEINRVFIDICLERDLEVVEGDAIESLRAMKDSSVGAITLIHVIEHLPFERAIALLDEARRILRPSGLILLETPNPENLSVGHHWFYMDPTHRNPLPPEALRWTVEARGFNNVHIERLFVARELNVPPLLEDDVPGAAGVNAVLASMSASQDYAVIGTRP